MFQPKMYISQQLRNKNIAEYLLYMWQVEDTIRAFDCSLSRIKREYIERFDYDEEQKEEVVDCCVVVTRYFIRAKSVC